MENAVKIENVTKNFKNTVVIENISAAFEKNKIHGIIGRNGSGKTVLLKLICGILIPDSGKVYINENELNNKKLIPNIGAIIENPAFMPAQSGYKNLEYLASIRNIIGKDEIRTAIKRVGLDPDDKKHVGKYSLGMRQRLGLAQAIMENPDILILDEPMNGLDNDGVRDMRQYLLDIKSQGKTILIASHSKEDIDTLCDTVHEMDKGKLARVR